MEKRESIFTQDWHDSLKAHYKDIVRRNDKVTEETFVKVLYDVGFREDDLQRLKLEATMRAEDLKSDFVPSLEIPHTHDGDDSASVYAGVDVPQPESTLDVAEPEASIDDVPEIGIAEPEIEPTADEILQPTVEDIPEIIPEEAEEAVADDGDDEPPADAPQQMSMF